MELISSPCSDVSQMIKDLCYESALKTIKHNTKDCRHYSENEILQRLYDKGDLPNLHEIFYFFLKTLKI